jgi:hypothetical protein
MAVFRKGEGFIPTITPLYSIPRPLTAAASTLRIDDKKEMEQFRDRRSAYANKWQSEAWEYYDAIGEIKYAFNLVASVVSRVRLYTAVIDDPAEAPVPIRNSNTVEPQLSSAAERALERLNSAYGGQAGLLRDAALNLNVTGECYLVQRPELIGTGLPESWDIRSTDELTVDQRGTVTIVPRADLAQAASSNASKKGVIKLPNTAFVGRIWRSHPRYSEDAESSLKGLLDLCDELLLLNRTFRATARSRLNAGALYLPDGLSTSAAADPDYPFDPADDVVNTPESAEDEFEDQLIDAMTTPISDESSASAVVPLIIRGPAELGDKIKQFKFERSFDPALAQRADRVLERILQGLDVPKDIVTGLANVRYSNAVQIDESLYKAHIEPLLLLICDALTVVYLRPYLKSIGYEETDVQRIVVWFDPSAISTRNDRAADADSGFEKMAISLDTWRRTHGFSDADAPEPTEIALRLLFQRGAITPELSEALLNTIAPELFQAARASQQANSPAPITPEIAEALAGGDATPAPAEEATPEPEPITPSAAPPTEAPPISLAEPL